jgi:hypothetical protein
VSPHQRQFSNKQPLPSLPLHPPLSPPATNSPYSSIHHPRNISNHAYLQESQSESHAPPLRAAARYAVSTNEWPANSHQVQREHKKADAAGTRVPVKANGLPVKPPKATAIVGSSFSFSSSITFFPPATRRQVTFLVPGWRLRGGYPTESK